MDVSEGRGKQPNEMRFSTDQYCRSRSEKGKRTHKNPSTNNTRNTHTQPYPHARMTVMLRVPPLSQRYTHPIYTMSTQTCLSLDSASALAVAAASSVCLAEAVGQ